MRRHERLNHRSTSISGECCQVTESGVTEPGLQADSMLRSLFEYFARICVICCTHVNCRGFFRVSGDRQLMIS